MTNRVDVWRYSLSLTIETNNFAFEVKGLLDQKIAFPEWSGGYNRIKWLP